MPRIRAFAAAVLLAGCTTEGPRYGEYRPAPTYAPPTILHTHHQATPTAPTATKPIGAGALASAAVEGYMDNQESALRAALRGTGATVGRLGDALVLNIRSDAVFDSGSMAISPQGRAMLGRIALVARRFDSTNLAVNGFTDTTGSLQQNLEVSQKRADAVSKALTYEGVDPHRIAARGYGEASLKIPTGANVDELRNRRIEIRITPVVKA